jgi:hypothetical protein
MHYCQLAGSTQKRFDEWSNFRWQARGRLMLQSSKQYVGLLVA